MNALTGTPTLDEVTAAARPIEIAPTAAAPAPRCAVVVAPTGDPHEAKDALIFCGSASNVTIDWLQRAARNGAWSAESRELAQRTMDALCLGRAGVTELAALALRTPGGAEL